jgi:hypothetical protein
MEEGKKVFSASECFGPRQLSEKPFTHRGGGWLFIYAPLLISVLDDVHCSINERGLWEWSFEHSEHDGLPICMVAKNIKVKKEEVIQTKKTRKCESQQIQSQLTTKTNH